MAAPDQDSSLVTVGNATRYAVEYGELGRRVMIAGGEALLYFDHVLAMCRAIAAQGIPVDFIESNGSWCTSDDRVTERLSLLRDAGVRGMYFSIDAYHLEFVSAERICRGIRIADQIFGEDKVDAPRMAEEEARELETVAGDATQLERYARQRRVSFIGRAADELAAFHPPIPLEQLSREDCQADLDVDALHEVQVDAFGCVRPDMCPGVNLGNARDASLVELVQTRRVRETPLLQELAAAGPASLLPLAEKHGFAPREAYASKCALCFEIRRHLVDLMPAEFGPPHVYRHCPGS